MLKKNHYKKQLYLYPPIFSSFKKVAAKFTTIHTSYDRLIKDTDKPIVGLNQVHKDEIIIVEKIFNETLPHRKYIEIKEGDGLITTRTDLWLSVRSADCVPILMYDPEKNVIAAIHSGWRSTLKSISLKALKAMTDTFQTQAKNVFVSLGPAICFNCFDVGVEVMEKFQKKFQKINTPNLYYQKNKKYFIDLKKIIISELVSADVPLSQIENSPHCTHCQEIFPSYRAGDKNTRMYSLISLLK